MLKQKNLTLLSFLILGVFLLSSCFLQPPETEGLLKGQVLVPEGTLNNKDIVGQALSDATVNILDLATLEILSTTITDSDGYYQVSVSPGGPYLLEAAKDGVKLEQITCPVEVGMEYDLGTADCTTTAAALIAQAMMDAGNNPADIDCADIIADPHFDDVSSIVCSIIKAGGDPTVSAAVLQAVEDFLYPPEPAPTPNPTPPSDAKVIKTFDFKALDPDVIGVIDEGAKTITLTVPFGTEVTALVPTIVHTGVTISPASGAAQDFTSPVTYTVTAEDASTQDYMVTVTEELSVINISAIPGVTAPVPGAAPVTAITPTDQYTGIVDWYPVEDPFQEDKIYIATITLTPKPGFTLTGVSANFFTVTGAIIVTNETDSRVVTAVFLKTLEIGDSYGGGIIAYILQSGDYGYVAGEHHGLISATADAPLMMVWSNVDNLSAGATELAIGTGQANTAAIVSQAGCTSGAAYYCDTLTVGGYDDWFLPSKDELHKLWLNKDKIGGFIGYFYWSSSESNAESAWYQDFDMGYQGYYYKFYAYRVRAVRYF
jgi:hypothetical protein